MINKSILIVEDDEQQAKALTKTIRENFADAHVFYASSEEDINNKIENSYYNLILLDIRMDNYEINGIEIADKVIESNPFAKILFVSRFITEYTSELNRLLSHGRVLGFSEKEDYKTWGEKLKKIISEYYASIDVNGVSKSLIDLYAEAKNEEDSYKKGLKFENFVILLFRMIGFSEINTRIIDKSRNEVDIVIRNDIEDAFLCKFGKYILIECKNTKDKTNKNDFNNFYLKVGNTNTLSEIGILITSSSFTATVYKEAVSFPFSRTGYN